MAPSLVYRKVFPCMWGDQKFRALSAAPPNAQTLWVYLLAGEHVDQIPGLSRAGEAALAEALGWPVDALRACWREIEAQGMARADWTARVVWLPNAVRYNPPENPNVVTSWARAWAGIPECALKDDAREALLAHVTTRGKGFVRAFEAACPVSSEERFREPLGEGSEERFREPLGEGSANHEHEHEHEQEQEHAPASRAVRGAANGSARPAAGVRSEVDRLKTVLEAAFDRTIGPAKGEGLERLEQQLARHGRAGVVRLALEIDALLRTRGKGPLGSLEALPGFLETVEPGGTLEVRQAAPAAPVRDIRYGSAPPSPHEAFQGGERKL